MKLLNFNRNASKINFTCIKGDVYKDRVQLIENGLVLYESDYANTISTNGYNGGRIPASCFFSIVSHRTMTLNGKDIDVRVIKYFNNTVDYKLIKSDKDLTLKDMTLPSSIPNPNHNGELFVEVPQCHPGGFAWDWSHACSTILNDVRDKNLMEFDRMMSYLPNDNEIVAVKITD